MALPIQQALEGKYEILEKIGEGGIGSVYKVKHRLLEEIRVIKVLRPQAASKEDLQERFVHEARMAIRLKQLNIAQLHDFAVTPDGTAYIVMEFIDGVGLDALLQASGPPSLGLSVEVSRQGLTALGYLHAHRFVHRDVSPDNLMLCRDYDGKPLVKLIDLGIAKNLEGGMELTATGVFVGKVRYSSPEQFSAQGGGDEIDHRSDIYSFGVMLYELLTGEMPVGGESFSEVAGGHLFHPPRPFDETDPDSRIPEELRSVVLRALEKEPEKRFQTTEEFIAALEPFARSSSKVEKETANLIEKTRATLPSGSGTKKPGSTQNRLDAEFGLGSTPEPTILAEADPATTTATPSQDLKLIAGNIDNLIRAGRFRPAERALEKAVDVFGDIRPLADLRDRLTAARAKSGSEGALAGRKIVLVAAGAALALLAAIGAWMVLRDGSAPARSLSARGERIAVTDTPTRFDPSAPAGEPLIGEDDPLEAPVFLDEQTEATGGTTADVAAEDEESRAADSATSPDRPARPPGGNGGEPPPARRPPGPGPAGPGRGGPPPRTTTEIFTAGAVGVMPPVLLNLPPAVYPLDKPPRNDVVFVVTVLVDEFGKPMNPSIKRGPPFRKKVRDTAMEIAMGARFRPAVKNGVAGRMWTDVQVVFRGVDG